MPTNTLPAGFTLRNAASTDLEGVADLIRAVCEADGDPDDAISVSELKSEWETNFNLDTDVWVVADPTGKIVGYEEFLGRSGHASLNGDGYVHPQFNNMGLAQPCCVPLTGAPALKWRKPTPICESSSATS